MLGILFQGRNNIELGHVYADPMLSKSAIDPSSAERKAAMVLDYKSPTCDSSQSTEPIKSCRY